MIASSDIEQMSIEERLQAIELLWESIPQKDEALDSPPWHGDVLKARFAKAEAGQGEFLTIPELRRRLHRAG
ncbi:MAG TPA: addiction module protein [Bacteroidia bacterium]|nr:addiction module protein [Bacteroidia bacterium]